MELNEATEKLNAAAERLEAAAARLEQQRGVDADDATETAAVDAAAAEAVAITATVASAREEELERRLAAAEATITELRAGAAVTNAGRKTAVAMQAKGATADGNALDAALSSLSIEQRFAVKAAMLRAGLVG